MKILTAAEMRDVDRLTTERYGVPSLTLMENAGKSVADFIASRFPDFKRRPILVLCGKGNNGGDGFVVARHLRKLGAKPVVHLFGDPGEVKGDAATNLRRWKKASGQLVVVRNSLDYKKSGPESWEDLIVVDALLGTGARGEVTGTLRQVIENVNAHAGSVVAVDIPSALNADTGVVEGVAIMAPHTVTFTAPKPGLFLGEGPRHTGELIVREIGSPREFVSETGKGNLMWSDPREFVKFAVPRKPEGHKGDYGHALIVAGSVGKSGAAVLASWAALRAGAGLVTVATPEPVLPIVAAHTPEVMTEPLAATKAGTISERCLEGNFLATLLAGKRALAMGPGISTQAETQTFVRGVLKAYRHVPIVLDADGLNAFAGRATELRHPDGLLCVTPHPGEMARLLGCTADEVQARRVELARKAAADWNACVVLKGHHTVIAAPSGATYINSTGNPGMATGGTGDVLTGLLAGLVAQYAQKVDATGYAQLVAFGVYLHGLAGDIAYADTGQAPLMASDLIFTIPRAYRQFYAECGRG
ncbi:MAG: NAD(P)H-hydrate dehydratase [Candidatus Acidiferrales bacterium]|jgi:NAD(P)H-hydrate epimerase